MWYNVIECGIMAYNCLGPIFVSYKSAYIQLVIVVNGEYNNELVVINSLG